MKEKTALSQKLWGPHARVSLLLATAALILFCALGGRELWTQEWRWADISWYMMYSGDYLHPLLAGTAYYDKPLLSYWVMVLFSHLVGGLNEWALRLPAALAGMLAIWSVYRIGSVTVNRQAGLMAGWMLASTYFFIFWARTANADMLNLAGTLLAIQWYFEHKERPTFFSYVTFFLILAVTALFKGLIGIAIPLLAILPDVIQDKNWQKYLSFKLIFALLPAIGVYLLPFWASTHFGGQHYAENGLYEVYRENILRYFAPFDHQGPIYTYLIYLPIYMLPWAFLFIPALATLPKRWAQMNSAARWSVWSTLIIFLFLTFSGSRRNYYVLPLVPFAILLTAQWLATGAEQAKRLRWTKYLLFTGLLVSFVSFGVVQPLYYSGGGVRPFAKAVQASATAVQPWQNWNIVFLDARSKITLYLNPARPIQLLNAPGNSKHVDRDQANFTDAQLVAAWPMIAKPPTNTIFVSRVSYLAKLQPYFKNYTVIMAPLSLGERVLPNKDSDRPIAFIPK